VVHQPGSYLGMAKGLFDKDVVNQVLSPKAPPAEDKLFILRITGDEEPRLPPAFDGFDSFSHGSEKI